MANNMKHVGKMTNGQKLVVLYRTVPNEEENCLVVLTSMLSGLYHDRLMELVESDEGQQSNQLSDLLSRRFFSDGENILNSLHRKGLIKKVPTNTVLLTPNGRTAQPLDEVNSHLNTQSAKATSIIQQVEKAAQSEQLPVINESKQDGDSVITRALLAQAESFEREAASLRARVASLQTNSTVPDVKSKKRGRPTKAG